MSEPTEAMKHKAAEIKAIREAARLTRQALNADQAAFIVDCVRAEVPVHDIAYLLGISRPRVYQIVTKAFAHE